MFEYPNIDPIIFSIGGLAVSWYSLSYIAGIVLGCLYADYLNKKPPVEKNLKVYEDFLTYLIIGILVGGRLGYVLFYNFSFYLENPVNIFKVWQGGMSFHGGFGGVMVAVVIYARKKDVSIARLLDLAACSAPIGLFFGRIANFINGELYGKVTDSAFGMVFPTGGEFKRHPSQLYEAFLEGLLLFIILFVLANFTKARQAKFFLSSIFLIGYGASRFFVEFFREPDKQLGYVFDSFTMGQLLCVPMIIAGFGFMIYSIKQRKI